MGKFIFNNIKNTNTGYIFFELKYSYYFCVFFNVDINPCFYLKTAVKLLAKPRKLVIIYQKKSLPRSKTLETGP